MPEHKKQHIIPGNYLKGFSKVDYFKNDNDNFPVWIYDLEKKTLKIKSPQNIAWRPYYYSFINENGDYQHSLEEEFSKLEGMVNALVREIDSNIRHFRDVKEIPILTHNDRMLLIHFIFWNMEKVPSIVEPLHKGIKEILVELSQKYNSPFSEAEAKNRTLQLMMEIGTRGEFDFVKVLSRKDFRIIYLPNNDTSFVTTDNPVVRFNNTDADGIAIPSTEIYFPLNQRCMVFLHGTGNKFEYFKFSIRKDIYQLNKVIAANAQYFIIARDKEYLVKILNELKYEFKNSS